MPTFIILMGLGSASWIPSQSGSWENSRAEVCLLPNAQSTLMSEDEVRRILESAVSVWLTPERGGTVACGFELTLDNRACRPVTEGTDNQTNVYFVQEWNRGSATLGFTQSTVDTSRTCVEVTDDSGTFRSVPCRVGSDIEFNDQDVVWDRAGTVGVDLFTVAAHEFGHLVGLGHCEVNQTCGPREALMFGGYTGPLSGVLPDDREGVCGLYPFPPADFGEVCATAGDCESNACTGSDGELGLCSVSCGTCPSDFSCEFIQGNMLCQPDSVPICSACDVDIPSSCGNGARCSDLDDALGPVCRPTCPGGCPLGSRCSLESDVASCVDLCRGTAPAGIGESCVDRPCDLEGVCVGRCLLPCTGPSDCDSFQQCTSRFDRQFCLPVRPEGSPCDEYTVCELGRCLALPGEAPLCVRECSPGICGADQTCEMVSIRPGATIGVCQPTATVPGPDLGPSADAGFMGTDAMSGRDGDTIGLPPAPGEVDSTSPIEGSCSCRDADLDDIRSSSRALVLILLLGFWTRVLTRPGGRDARARPPCRGRD
ncbi:MAG: matrixin family metalloprotease [Myxococcota bacterium]